MESTVEKEAKARNIDCNGKRRVGCPVVGHDSTKSMIEKRPVPRMHVAHILWGGIVRKRVATAARK